MDVRVEDVHSAVLRPRAQEKRQVRAKVDGDVGRKHAGAAPLDDFLSASGAAVSVAGDEVAGAVFVTFTRVDALGHDKHVVVFFPVVQDTLAEALGGTGGSRAVAYRGLLHVLRKPEAVAMREEGGPGRVRPL